MIGYFRKFFALIALGLAFSASAQVPDSKLFAKPGDILTADIPYSSPNGRYHVIFQSSDGNLVVYKGNVFTSANAIWTSKSSGKGGKFAVFQADGNFVIYKNLSDPASAIWNSGTQGTPRPNANVWAGINDIGQFIVYGYGGSYVTPQDITAGTGGCTVPREYAVCVFPGTAAQFNSVVYACSIADATNIAIATGASYGACR